MEKIQNEALDEQLYATYWHKLQQAKYDLVYYEIHLDHCIRVIRRIKYLVIGVTSLATGAWMQWNDNSDVRIVCAILIWLLQGVSAISGIFPYEKRKLELREMITDLEPLYLQMENDWRIIQSLKMSNQDISDTILQYEQKQAAIKKHYFKDDSLPGREKFRTKADESTEEYFKYFA